MGQFEGARNWQVLWCTQHGQIRDAPDRSDLGSTRFWSDPGRLEPVRSWGYPKPNGIRDFLTCRETPRKSGLELGRIRKKRRCPKSDGFWIFLAHRCRGEACGVQCVLLCTGKW